jgi:negative regulator of sigma E activity
MQIQIDILAAAITTVVGIVWLVRLEGRINYQEKFSKETQKDVDELRIKHENLDDKLLARIGELEKTLARIEGALTIINKDKE